MSIHKLIRVRLIGVFGLCALIAQADLSVPAKWNVTPWTDGASFESFNNTLPAWANKQTNVVDGAAERTDRFWASTGVAAGKQLVFSTSGITNMINGAIIQPGVPIFADMRCKINSFGVTPPTIAANTMLCFYANQNSNLVLASSWECKTNLQIKVSPTIYYSVLIRFASDKFDLFFTNSTDAVLSLNATTNQIAKFVMVGDGGVDDLYLSYGDPRRMSTNSLALFSGGYPANAEEEIVANWIANKTNSGTFAKSDAEQFYLTDTQPYSNQFGGELGIGSITYNPGSTSVTVVVTLKTDATTKKQGKINGVLRLKGAQTYAQAASNEWSTIVGAIKSFGADDFNNGLATYTFTLPDATYKFFLPVIQSKFNE